MKKPKLQPDRMEGFEGDEAVVDENDGGDDSGGLPENLDELPKLKCR